MNADADISPLSQKFRGSLIGPSDPNYDRERALYNGMIDKRGRQYWQAVHPFNPGGAYVNFMMDDEAGERLTATYGDNYPALVNLKRKCDPENLLSLNQNIAPC